MSDIVNNSFNFQPKLDKLEADLPIAVDSVDFTLNNKDQLISKLSHVFNYFGRVENEVALNANQLAVMLPNANDDTKRFIRIWNDQEVSHGRIFDKLQQQLDLKPAVIDPNSVSKGIHLAGEISCIPKIHDLFMFLYLSRGAMHERLTAGGYRLLEKQLKHLGETALVETAIKPIQRQEAEHLGYYQMASLAIRHQLAPWQIRLARYITQKVYQPVGVTNEAQGVEFGRVAKTLAGNNITEFIEPVQRIADKLLAAPPSGNRLLPRLNMSSINKEALIEPNYVIDAVDELIKKAA